MPSRCIRALILTTCIFFSNGEQREKRASRSEYDFVIIGSGSAGCALANRLSEVPEWNVLLLEIGSRPIILNEVPAVSAYLQFTNYNWPYKMERTPNACLGFTNERCNWSRGRGLGGSSLINFMVYSRGNKNDYERWKDEGNPGWSYEDVLPYYKKSERVHLKKYDKEYHGRSGPISVEDIQFKGPLAEAFIEAGKELNYKVVDYNGKEQSGFSYIQTNTDNGRRSHAAKGYIDPVVHRPNLHILTESRGTKILINPITKEAYGVEFVRNKKFHYVNVTKEVIASGGALLTPQLLMLSGIGPKKHLQPLGVSVIQDLPVGQNLRDHIAFIGLAYEINSSAILSEDELTNYKNSFRWLFSGKGPLASLGGAEALAFIHTNVTHNKYNLPDVELIFNAVRYNQSGGAIIKNMVGLSEKTVQNYYRFNEGKNIWTIRPSLIHPKSVGHLELKSTDPFEWPKFYGNYLSKQSDVKTLLAAIRISQALAKTSALQKYGSTIVKRPIPGCEQHTFDTDEYWECSIRHLTISIHHQIGTCRMGPQEDKTAVVNNKLKVHGMKRLRVVDTSILPFTLSGHTNGPAFMIGEKAADFIKEDWGKLRKSGNQL